MQYQKNENVFDLRKKILSKQNINFNTLFYQCLVTSSRVSNNIVKYRYSLLFSFFFFLIGIHSMQG